jgi:tetratricopeptide (TPR) repeat protein
MNEPTDMHAALQAAEALYAAGKLPQSEAAFNALLGSDERAGALCGLGRISYHTDKLGRAQALFEQSLGVERRNPDALCYLGRTLVARGSPIKAIAYLEEALVYQPDHEQARRELELLKATASPDGKPRGSAAGDNRGQWEQWARNQFGDNPQTVRVAVEAAMRAASNGASSQQAAEAATAAAVANTPPPQGLPLRPPSPPRDPNALVGIVTQLTKTVAPWGGRPAAQQLWNFRLEIPGAPGGSTTRVGVQMRGHEINGTLDNGDWVEISEQPKPGRVYQPKVLRNLSVGGVVKSRRLWTVAG